MIEWLGMEDRKDNFEPDKFDLKNVNSSLLEI